VLRAQFQFVETVEQAEQQGAFFLLGADPGTDEPVLRLTSAYGYGGEHGEFRLGEGLVGQAAFDGKPIRLSDVPDDYIKVASGLGEATPSTIQVMPIMFEEQVLGELNPLSRKGRMMRRRFHGRSHDETLDSAGRVRIPKHLIEHAQLEEGPCVVIGVADHRWICHLLSELVKALFELLEPRNELHGVITR